MLASWSAPMALVAQSGHPSLMLPIVTGLVALLLSLLVPLINHSLTMAHEGGHATMALLLGGKNVRVTLKSNRGGETTPGGIGWFASILAALAGYLGPSLFGLLGALMLAADEAPVVLFTTLVLLVLLLVIIDNLFGRFSVLAALAVFLLAARYGSDPVQAAVAYTWVWLLLIGGFTGALEASAVHRQARQRGEKGAGDPKILRDLTLLPASLWVAVFIAGTFISMVFGGSILLGAELA